MFAKGSRYETVPDVVWTDPAGREIVYKRLRVIPSPGPAVQGYLVSGGDRLDLIAFRLYRDPEQFWRICDANDAMNPPDLTARPGRALRVALPQAQG
jgi:hypothetical protein